MAACQESCAMKTDLQLFCVWQAQFAICACACADRQEADENNAQMESKNTAIAIAYTSKRRW